MLFVCFVDSPYLLLSHLSILSFVTPDECLYTDNSSIVDKSIFIMTKEKISSSDNNGKKKIKRNREKPS